MSLFWYHPNKRSDALESKVKVVSTTANTSLISSAVTSNAKGTSETTSDPVPYQLKCYPMFTTHDFYSQSKYQVLNSRDTQKSAILINFSVQYSVKSFLRQDAAHHVGVTGGKLLRVKTT